MAEAADRDDEAAVEVPAAAGPPGKPPLWWPEPPPSGSVHPLLTYEPPNDSGPGPGT